MGERITQRTIKHLKPPDQGSKIVWDGELKGFGAKVTESGAVSFFLNYRCYGRQRRYKIGNAPEWTVEAARAEAEELKPRIRKGFDPLDEKRKAIAEPTIADLSAEYLNDREGKSESTKRNEKSAIAHIVNPKLGRLRLAAVTSRDIEKLKADLSATPYRANRVLALLSHMFSKAIKWKLVTSNPVKGIERYYEDKRDRWLQDEELKRLTEALDAYPDQHTANALRLIALTGSRKGEVLKASWEQFDLGRGIWTKPSHHTKQRKTETIPLNQSTIALLVKMRPEDATGPLFPGRVLKNDADDPLDAKKPYRVSLRKPWMQVCKAAGFAKAVQVDGKRLVNGKPKKLTKWKPLVRIHDLRHTFASHLVSHGTSLQIVGKLIGHTQIKTTERYAHLADSALRDATNDFGNIFDGNKPLLQVVSTKKDARRNRAVSQ